VTIGPDDDVEQRRKDIIEAVKRVDSGEGVAILTDMFGGTPSNLAISVMGRPKVEVLAGINLPMLVKARQGAGRMSADRGGGGCAGLRPQIHHHRQPRSSPGNERAAGVADSSSANHPPGSAPIIACSKSANKKGLHARASAKFVQTVERFDCEVKVKRGHEVVGGTSIMA